MKNNKTNKSIRDKGKKKQIWHRGKGREEADFEMDEIKIDVASFLADQLEWTRINKHGA